jgi:C2 domain
VRLAHTAERTKTDKRGGQSPFWDHETRFPIPLNAGPDYSSIKVTVFSDDSKDPILIGDATIDLKPVLKEGEFDEWVEIQFRNRYAGEVYIEMTYYSEAPPPLPVLPKEVQSRNLQSRGSSPGGSLTRLKHRPLPQQPDLGGGAPPPSRGFQRLPYDQLPPSTSHSNYSSMEYSRGYHDEYEYNSRPPRSRALDYEVHHKDYDSAYENYPDYPPTSPGLGRHRSEASLRTQYYDIRPLHDVEATYYSQHDNFPYVHDETYRRRGTSLPPEHPEQYPPRNAIRDELPRPRTSFPPTAAERNNYPMPEERIRPRTSLPVEPDRNRYPAVNALRAEVHARPRTSLPLPVDNHFVSDLRVEARARPRTSLPLPAGRDHIFNHVREDSHFRPRTSLPLPAEPTYADRPGTGTRRLSPKRQNSQDDYYHTAQPVDDSYSPVVRQESITRLYEPPVEQLPVQPYISSSRRQSTPQPPTSQTYSPAPPPHRTPPVHPLTPVQKPLPIRPIDHLPPSTFAPERNPPWMRRPLPTPPGSQERPEVPAKIPLGMSEEEYWAGVEDKGGRGLEQGSWRQMRDVIEQVGHGRR